MLTDKIARTNKLRKVQKRAIKKIKTKSKKRNKIKYWGTKLKKNKKKDKKITI